MLSSDVLVLNHTLFFTLLGTLDEDVEGGILFRNDFVVFDEAHTMESVASKHIGLSLSNGQLRYALQRLWNPNTKKGLLGTLGHSSRQSLVNELLQEADEFFHKVEFACEDLRQASKSRSFGGGEAELNDFNWIGCHPDINLPESPLRALLERTEEFEVLRDIWYICKNSHQIVPKDFPFMLPNTSDGLCLGRYSSESLAQLQQCICYEFIRHGRAIIKPEGQQDFEAAERFAHKSPALRRRRRCLQLPGKGEQFQAGWSLPIAMS